MPGETKIYTPEARVESSITASSPSHVEINASLNSDLQIEYSPYTGKEAAEGANRVLSSEVASFMGSIQQIAHEGRSSPDTRVTMSDGSGNTISAEGFTTGPSYRGSRQNFQLSVNCTAAAAVMEHLKLDIYSPRFGGERGENAPLSLGRNLPSSTVKDGNLAIRLKSLTEKLVSTWQSNKEAEDTPPIGRGLKEIRHQTNIEGPLNSWYTFLDNSVSNLENSWLPEMASNPAFNTSFNEDLVAVLRGTSAGFSRVIKTLMENFQLVKIPSRDGSPGSFQRLSSLLQGDTETLSLDPSSLEFSTGNDDGLLPVNQVLMRGLSRKIHNTDPTSATGINQPEGMIVAGFPEEAPASSGDPMIINAPYFLSKIIPWFSTSVPRGNKKPNYKNFTANYNSLIEAADEYTNSMIAELVRDYCQSAYINMSLGGSVVGGTIPANFSLWPGKRYEVTDTKGNPLFTGFLNSVNHTLTRKPERGVASTRVQFSHVEFTGFTLPST